MSAEGAGATGPGRRVRDLRRARGWTQGELAARCDITVPYLSQVENGHHLPSARLARRLASALDADPATLFPTSFRVSGPESLALGGRIRTRREELGCTTSGLASRCGIGIGTVRGIEEGRRGISGAVLVRIARALGVAPEALLGLEPAGPTPEDMTGLHVPADLARFAEDLHLGFVATLRLLRAWRALRPDPGAPADWPRFFSAVREFLDGA